MNKLKILTVLILIIIVIGFIFGINTIYKFCVIQKMYSVISENVQKENYYLISTIKNSIDNTTTQTKIYYKDGIGKLIAENGIYTWADGERAYIVDEENKTIYLTDIESTIGLVSGEMFASFYPCYSYSFLQKILFAGNINNKIKTVKIDGQKFLMIEIPDEKSTKTIWVYKDTFNLKKAEIKFPDGETFEYEYDLGFGLVSIRNVELPDTTDYKFINNKTGEVITNN